MKKKEIIAQAKFVHVDGLGLVMQIHDFNELIDKFKAEDGVVIGKSIISESDRLKSESGLKRALKQRAGKW